MIEDKVALGFGEMERNCHLYLDGAIIGAKEGEVEESRRYFVMAKSTINKFVQILGTNIELWKQYWPAISRLINEMNDRKSLVDYRFGGAT